MPGRDRLNPTNSDAYRRHPGWLAELVCERSTLITQEGAQWSAAGAVGLLYAKCTQPSVSNAMIIICYKVDPSLALSLCLIIIPFLF